MTVVMSFIVTLTTLSFETKYVSFVFQHSSEIVNYGGTVCVIFCDLWKDNWAISQRIHHNFSIKDLEFLIYLLTIANSMEEELIPLAPWILGNKSIPEFKLFTMCNVTAVTESLSLDMETFSKTKDETRTEGSYQHKQVRRENEHNINMWLVDWLECISWLKFYLYIHTL